MYSELFVELAPYYYAMGMTPTDYWDGDIEYPKQFRKAEKIRREKASTDAWLQGYYIYETLIDVAPLYRFGVRHPKAAPYFEEPIPVTEEAIREAEEAAAKQKMEKGKNKMLTFAVNVNARFKNGSTDPRT